MKNLPLSLTVSAISGAFTLLRPADWSPQLRRAFVVVPGTLAVGGLAAVLFRPAGRNQHGTAAGDDGSSGAEPGSLFVQPLAVRGLITVGDGGSAGAEKGPLFARPPAVRALIAVGAGVVVSGIQMLSLRLDERLERWLLKHRVPAPRYWMALAVALASLAVDLMQDPEDESGPGAPEARP
ncbi:hypothetical protein [Arthrobacter sp. G119Y2]|uniref:hypothetical protein n=1 Tax=Arthrobacter sp. G119Y2 TaxID=3134965 RepID=UPI0031198713